eukprot:scaffold11328_cov66-Cyclotella_meneghiniana.AAC.9
MDAVMVDGTSLDVKITNCRARGALRADPRSYGPALRCSRGHCDLVLSLTIMSEDEYVSASLVIGGCSSIEKLGIGRLRGLWSGDARLGGGYLAKVSPVGVK